MMEMSNYLILWAAKDEGPHLSFLCMCEDLLKTMVGRS